MCQPYDIHNVLRHSGNASWDRLQPTVTLQRISVCKIVHTFFESFVATLKLHYLIIKFHLSAIVWPRQELNLSSGGQRPMFLGFWCSKRKSRKQLVDFWAKTFWPVCSTSCSPLQPKPTQTWLVNDTQTTNGNQDTSGTKVLADRLQILYADICL